MTSAAQKTRIRGDGSLYKRGRIYYLDYTGPDGVRHQESAKTSDADPAQRPAGAAPARRRRPGSDADRATRHRQRVADDRLTNLEVDEAVSVSKARSHLKAVREVLGANSRELARDGDGAEVPDGLEAGEEGSGDDQPPLRAAHQAYNLAARSTPKKVRREELAEVRGNRTHRRGD